MVKCFDCVGEGQVVAFNGQVMDCPGCDGSGVAQACVDCGQVHAEECDGM